MHEITLLAPEGLCGDFLWGVFFFLFFGVHVCFCFFIEDSLHKICGI